MENELYDDGRIKIFRAEAPDEHNVEVGKNYCYFGRGILKELVRSDSKRLKQNLEAINPLFLGGLQTEGVSLEQLGCAISKARVSELEDEVEFQLENIMNCEID